MSLNWWRATRSLGGAFDPKASYNRDGAHDIGVSNIRKMYIKTADGALALEPSIVFLEKGSAAAMTLAAPVLDGRKIDGIEITIVAGTPFAHVVTGTDLFWAGATGGPFNKITTAAFIGSGATIVSRNGLWLVISNVAATIGD